MKNTRLYHNQGVKVQSGRSIKILGLVSTLIFIGFQVFITNHYSGQGGDLMALESRKQVLLKINQSLQSDVAELGSLERVRELAKSDLKFVGSDDRLDYLVPPGLAAQ